MTSRIVKAPQGSKLTCKNWVIEAAYRMIQNNLDPEVAEKPDELIVYGGIGKAARNWECFEAILRSLKNLNEDETLLIQSGKPVGVIKTHTDAPRVLLANSNLVPKWATWEHFHELDKKGLMMYGQMTAGSWIYIGTQGILQGTYETFAACGRKHFGAKDHPLKGRSVITAGLGGMGGAQPLAVKIAGGTVLAIEVDRDRLRRRISEKYLDEEVQSLEEGLSKLNECKSAGIARSFGLCGNVAEILPKILEKTFAIDVVTDQTSAHDPLVGYIPVGYSCEEASNLRKENQEKYFKEVYSSMAKHVEAMLEFQRRGSVVFDYGNNLRAMSERGGAKDTKKIPGFVPEYIRPLFCEGSGPFRWVALSGDPQDIAKTDEAILKLFPQNTHLKSWITQGAPQVKFQGLPARICWLKYGERKEAGLLFNDLVKRKIVSAPIVIGRDHLDCGSVASPNRETESMKDGSDAVSDWPLLNAMSNISCGASWVSLHHGGGVGMGYSQHSGVVIVADGTEEAAKRISRVLTSDPQFGVLRHVDAGYEKAEEVAKKQNIRIPMWEK